MMASLPEAVEVGRHTLVPKAWHWSHRRETTKACAAALPFACLPLLRPRPELPGAAGKVQHIRNVAGVLSLCNTTSNDN